MTGKGHKFVCPSCKKDITKETKLAIKNMLVWHFMKEHLK